MRIREDAGFTLIEVLVGVTLLAMLITVVAGVTQVGARAWTTAERRTGELDVLDAVQGLLRRIITQARPAYASEAPDDLTVLFAGAPDSLALVGPEPGTQGDGPWALQRLVLGRQDGAPALFLQWRVLTRPGEPAQPEHADRILDHVAALRLAYFGPEGASGVPAWQDSWSGRDALPTLVRLVIERDRTPRGGTPRNGARDAWPALVVAPLATTNATCVGASSGAPCRRMRPQ